MSPTAEPRLVAGPRDAEALEAEILEAWRVLQARMKGHFVTLARELGMFPPHAMALRLIDGPVSMKELGQRVGCDPSFVTAIADGLEERGLARREVDQGDRRVKNLVLTERGLATRARLEEELAAIPGLRELDAEERRVFLGLLRKMLDARAPVDSVDGLGCRLDQ